MTFSLPRSKSGRDRLTALQRDLLREFFRHEQRFFLTGGAALAGFYLGHREPEDLDLFAPPGPDLADAVRALHAAAAACQASSVRELRAYPDFRRLLVARGDESCIVDLVIDHAPMLDPQKTEFASVRGGYASGDHREQDLHTGRPCRDQGPGRSISMP